MDWVYSSLKQEVNREPIIEPTEYIKEMAAIDKLMNDTNKPLPTTGLLFKTKNANFEKISE